MHYEYTAAEKTNIVDWVTAAIKLLIDKDSDLLSPDKVETDNKIDGQKELNREVHETTINGRLERYIEDLISDFGYKGYNCDIEYNRYINQRKMVRSIETGQYIEVRPDIIVHKRLRLYEELPHLLVVEAKKYSNNEKDRNHVRDIMRDNNYCYKFGLLISYYESKTKINCELLSLEQDKFISQKFSVDK